MGNFPQTKGGVYAFFKKRAKAKKDSMPFFIRGDDLQNGKGTLFYAFYKNGSEETGATE